MLSIKVGNAVITKAKSAGFCYGVKRAVDMVYSLLDDDKNVSTFGPIIHNTEMVNEFKSKGVIISEDIPNVPQDYTVILRSHGVSREIYDQIIEYNLNYADATCPFVSKIHKIVYESSKSGKVVFILGDENHAEIKAIKGHCVGECYIFNNVQQLEELARTHEELKSKSIVFVVQTTYDVQLCKKCLESAKKLYTNIEFFDTICSATSQRQTEAKLLAEKSDLMIVIGDKHSSNSCKLYDICKGITKSLFIQNASEINALDIIKYKNIGLTAGASAPAIIIKEVLDKMTDILNQSGETTEMAEENFAEMLEENLKSFNNDGRVQGVVERITPNEVFVDVGRKQVGVVKLDELTNDPNAKIEDLVKIGDVLELLIMRTNDQEGVITLSKKKVDAAKGWETILAAQESQEILEGKVIEVIKGGVIVLSNGVRVFVPGSLATVSRNESLDNLLKTDVAFRVIEIKKARRGNGGTAVGSIRSVAKEANDKKLKEFWETCEVGKQYTGTVKSLASYGAFVDIGGIDGMIHISELSWSRIKHPSEIINVGDVVEVYVKDIDKEKNNISLGYKKTEDNPWEKLKNEYPVGTTVEAEVVGMTTFGAFAKILPGIDGLIHISQIANRRIEKPQDELSVGQKVIVKITGIEFDKKRVSLSIRALLEDEAKAKTEEADEVVATTEETAE